LASAGCVRDIVVVIAEFVCPGGEGGGQFPAGLVTVELLKAFFPVGFVLQNTEVLSYSLSILHLERIELADRASAKARRRRPPNPRRTPPGAAPFAPGPADGVEVEAPRMRDGKQICSVMVGDRLWAYDPRTKYSTPMAMSRTMFLEAS
jgi:hypothetical protein